MKKETVETIQIVTFLVVLVTFFLVLLTSMASEEVAKAKQKVYNRIERGEDWR
ncbi:hypothetical protein [Candidatus Magnetobacterium casense]|uniref:Secreted protein n=1 Tax=Candidatus Magnetobacterium casense TaxID=1455061 RepID=A0ABS6RWN0_9BACT|nr:hypothetical protein [Candidatus Magnetobacterium casensis]MBV6341042.1 hypothetical protein [Candidatus Magnetobacterium casensis]